MNSLLFSWPNLENPEPIEWPLNNVFTNKYGKIWFQSKNYKYLYENLQVVQSKFFTDKLIFI